MTAECADQLAPQIAAIDPFKQLGFDAARLRRIFDPDDPGKRCFALRVDDIAVGAVTVAPNWLAGPYLSHLSILPRFQRRGLGNAVVRWLTAEAKSAGARNVWICVSDFNQAARALYRSHGFVEAATLPDLLADGDNECLLRKQLF